MLALGRIAELATRRHHAITFGAALSGLYASDLQERLNLIDPFLLGRDFWSAGNRIEWNEIHQHRQASAPTNEVGDMRVAIVDSCHQNIPDQDAAATPQRAI